jgi:hypothetical protein
VLNGGHHISDHPRITTEIRDGDAERPILSGRTADAFVDGFCHPDPVITFQRHVHSETLRTAIRVFGMVGTVLGCLDVLGRLELADEIEF